MKCDEIFAALAMLEKERGISQTFMMDKIVQALTTAYKRDHEGVENVIVDVDEAKRDLKMYVQKEVVEEVENPGTQMSLEDAKKLSAKYEVGSIVNLPVDNVEFGRISNALQMAENFSDWCNIYRRITSWDIELSESSDASIKEVIQFQKSEANQAFSKFVRRNYFDWINRRDDLTPVMSHTLMRSRILPVADENSKTTLLLIDNFRYDQWRSINPLLRGYYDVAVDDFYCAILPTATQYARNAIFAGLMPLAIDRLMPERWLNDNEEGGKNQYEEEFLRRQLQSNGKNYRWTFDKLVRPEAGRKLVDNIQRIYDADFSVIVYNFLDILSHARTETDIIRELTEDEASFRSLTRSWFEHSDLFTLLRLLSKRGHTVIITSDHGTIRVDNPIRVTGDRETSPNLRYKTGRNLSYNPREVYEITRPEDIQLPRINLSSSYIFAYNTDFLVYNNDANRFIRYYKNTFQHGGISMEEMIVPYIVLKPKQ